MGAHERGVRPLLKRHGFWLVVLAGVLYLPTLGLSSLWDPWETHYGEVAREILVRHDWISLWWAHDGFFYSKPVLIFWMEAIAMAVTGVHVTPATCSTAAPTPSGRCACPTRCSPSSACTSSTGARRRPSAVVGAARRAGPGDEPLLVSARAPGHRRHGVRRADGGGHGLLMRGLYTGEEETARVHEVRLGPWTLRLSAWHLCIGAIVALALPQALYLASRNVNLVWTQRRPRLPLAPRRLPGRLRGRQLRAARQRAVHDREAGVRLRAGRPGRALAGGPRGPAAPAVERATYAPPALPGGLVVRRHRHARQGAGGFGLPVLCALAYVAATGAVEGLLDAEESSAACSSSPSSRCPGTSPSTCGTARRSPTS